MNLRKCEKGHFYDVDRYQTCPHCNSGVEPVLSKFNKQNNYLVDDTLLKERYLIKKVMGAGGFGITYEGYNLLTQDNIVIREYFPLNLVARNSGQKEIFIADNSKEFFGPGLRNFLMEANRLKSLNDIPGVINIIDCFEENNTGYIIMELLEGSSLREIIKVNGKLNYNIAKDFISNILRTMNQVHSRNIIHCDLSPNNIFVTKEGKVKVIDFGVSNNKTDPDITRTTMLNKAYAAPEQCLSNSTIGTWTDVYAIASIFYYMITNIRVSDCIERLSGDQLENPLVYCDEIPQKDATAIIHALALSIEDRTKEIKKFSEELGIDLTNSKEIRLDKQLFLSSVEFERKIEIERKRNYINQVNQDAKTGVLFGCGIDINKIHSVDIEKIPQEKQAFNMLLNQFKALDEEHRETLSELKDIKIKTESTKYVPIIMTMAEIITSIGISVLTSSTFAGSATIGAGIIMTILGLYMTYRK